MQLKHTVAPACIEYIPGGHKVHVPFSNRKAPGRQPSALYHPPIIWATKRTRPILNPGRSLRIMSSPIDTRIRQTNLIRSQSSRYIYFSLVYRPITIPWGLTKCFLYSLDSYSPASSYGSLTLESEMINTKCTNNRSPKRIQAQNITKKNIQLKRRGMCPPFSACMLDDWLVSIRAIALVGAHLSTVL